jgi:hypothetical protein
MSDGSHNETPADWVVTTANHWVYAGTGLANGSIIPGLIYYEWDTFVSDTFTPAGITVLASAMVPNNIRPGSHHETAVYERGSQSYFPQAPSISTSACVLILVSPRSRETCSREREQPRISHEWVGECAQRMEEKRAAASTPTTPREAWSVQNCPSPQSTMRPLAVRSRPDNRYD